jgi:hypothetical protein
MIALYSTGVSVAVDEFPPMLLGFLEPGTQFIEREGFSSITIVPEDKRELFEDAKKLNKDELIQKYPQVARQAEDLIEHFRLSQASRRADLPKGKKFGEPQIELYQTSGSGVVYTIKHIGNDFILLTYKSPGSVRRQAIAKSLISRIYWYEGPSFSLNDTFADK